MPVLHAEPAHAPKSLEELLALAHAMESDAAARYEAFAELMAEQGRTELAAVFSRVAEEERGHVAGVDAWSHAQLGKPPSTGIVPGGELPAFADDDEAEITGSALLSPYRALAIAVRNEERAFAFWAYLAAHAERDDVREAAERMASEELGHAATFRHERRKAFRRERDAGATEITAEDGEWKLAELVRQDAGRTPGGNTGPETENLAEAVRRAPGSAAVRVCLTPSTTAEQLAEELAHAYAGAVLANSEAASEWQGLAERAMKRTASMANRRRFGQR